MSEIESEMDVVRDFLPAQAEPASAAPEPEEPAGSVTAGDAAPPEDAGYVPSPAELAEHVLAEFPGLSREEAEDVVAEVLSGDHGGDELFDDDDGEEYAMGEDELRRFVADTIAQELGPLRANLEGLADVRQERVTGHTRQDAEAYHAFHRDADAAAQALGMTYANREEIVQGMFGVLELAKATGMWDGLDKSAAQLRRMAADVAAELYENNAIKQRALRRI